MGEENAPLGASLPPSTALRARASQGLLFVEGLWPRLVPATGILLVFAAVSWFGLFRLVPEWTRMGLLALFAGLFAASLGRLRGLRWPDWQKALSRLEADNRIVHQALAVQTDRPVAGDGFARALWQEHRQRMAARVEALHVGPPRNEAPRIDPLGIRAVAVLLFVTGFAYSHSGQSGRLDDAFYSHTDTGAAIDLRIDAWVTPPGYTAMAPLFLTAGRAGLPQTVGIPRGSVIEARITGGNGDGQRVTFAALDGETTIEPAPSADAVGSAARDYRFQPEAGGALVIAHDGQVVDRWQFSLIEDTPPIIAFDGEPGRAANGALEIGFRVRDDYGARKAHAEIVPVDPPAAGVRPLYAPPDYPLTLPRRNARDERGRESRDIGGHPFAGQSVRITLVAEDALGQTGRSEPHELVLPERAFTSLLAAAVVEQRQTLALDANKAGRAIDLSDALTLAPEETIANTTHYLLLKSARARIREARNDDGLRDAADYLWDIALGIENGALSVAERRLRTAQRALSEALGNGAPDAEIEALIRELRAAMEELSQALSRQASRTDDTPAELPPNARLLYRQDLDRLLDQIENLAKSGSRDQARQLLSELRRMLNNLETARRAPPRDNPLRQHMDRLGELMQNQRRLMDETFDLERALEALRNGGSGERRRGEQDASEEELREELRGLRRRQQGLRDRLEEFGRKLEAFGLDPGESLGEAEEAMGEAGEALGKADGAGAVDWQGRALEALRRGAGETIARMRQGPGQGPGDASGRGRGGPLAIDPLGRPLNNGGAGFGEDVKVPQEADIQRAKRILETIRKRLGETARPDGERFYLERLIAGD